MRSIFGCVCLLMPALAAGARAQEWQYRVTRATEVDATVRAGDTEFPLRLRTRARFKVSIVRREGRQVQEAMCEIEEAHVEETDAESGRVTARDLARPGDRVRLSSGAGAIVVRDATTGSRVDESLSDLLDVPLALDLLPPGALVRGRAWHWERDECSRRLGSLSLVGGRLELSVTGKTWRRATIAGSYRGKLDLDGSPVDCVATVRMVLFTGGSIPAATRIEGDLRGQAMISGEPATVAGRASMTQTAEPIHEPIREPMREPRAERVAAHITEPITRQPARDTPPPVAFRRIHEPRERAFSILVPHGWTVNGGIYRVNAAQAGGPLNAIEAKCDITFESDARGTVRFRRLPNIVYAVVRGPAAPMFPVGSNYSGARVQPLESAAQHLQNLFRHLHPRATRVEIVDARRLPQMVQAYRQAAQQLGNLLAAVGVRLDFDAAGMLVDYDEDGVRFRELLYTGITDRQDTWHNSDTITWRTPAAEFRRWQPVLDIMRYSVRLNPQWVLAEAGGQSDRAGAVLRVHDEVQRLSREIAARRSHTQAEIMNENYLMLTGQEEFVNPENGEVELDTNEYRYRWKTPGGDVFYTNDETADPNILKVLNRSDYRRTPVRKR